MQKKILGLLGILLIPFISAYNSYYSLPIDGQTILLGGIFMAVFAFVNYALAKVFRDSRAVPAIIAGVIAMFVVYGAYSSGLDITGFISNYGIDFDSEISQIIIGLIIFILIIWAIKLITFGLFLSVIGLAGIVAPFIFDSIEQKGAMLAIGIVLFVLGFILWMRRRSKLADAARKGTKWGFRKIRRGTKNWGARNFAYSAGMRRGGEKGIRGRFVSKKTVDKYAGIYGKRAAKKRFG